jgi:Rod binding domain-containing protein
MENKSINKIMNPLQNLPLEKGSGNQKMNREKLEKACKEFESLFMYQMLKTMHSMVPQNGLFGDIPGKDLYQTIMDQELSKNIAQHGGVGIGKMLYQQIIRKEEKGEDQSGALKPFPFGEAILPKSNPSEE